MKCIGVKIWDAKRMLKDIQNEFIFSWEPLLYNFFSSARPLKISFLLGKASQNFFFPPRGLSIFLFFLESASQNLFFPGKCLSKFIFSWRVPLKIYFFLEKGLWNFFFDFLRPHPQIIKGRPLTDSPNSNISMKYNTMK